MSAGSLAPAGSAAVFVDKDGTLVTNVPYNVDPARIALEPGAAEGMQALAGGGFRVIVISNQPGVALGLFPETALHGVEQKLRDLVREIQAFYYCPHAPDAGCECRKPSPGLLLRAAREHRVELQRSWMVGDILDDVEAGRRAGCRTILVDNGNETEWRLSDARRPDCIVSDLSQAAARILSSND
jgi:D-glycero-D-manno-heptose 1,7-bisphosphate phosphatase